MPCALLTAALLLAAPQSPAATAAASSATAAVSSSATAAAASSATAEVSSSAMAAVSSSLTAAPSDDEGGDTADSTPEADATRAEVLAALEAVGTIELRVGHPFPRATAKERIGYLLDYWRTRFGVRAIWRGFRVFLSGRLLGAELKAVFDVGEASVAARAADPGLFRGRAIDYAERKLRKYLHPSYTEP